MAEPSVDGKTSRKDDKAQAGVKMDVTDALTAKENGFGDIVTLNVGGRR